jgi:hypothetical protein
MDDDLVGNKNSFMIILYFKYRIIIGLDLENQPWIPSFLDKRSGPCLSLVISHFLYSQYVKFLLHRHYMLNSFTNSHVRPLLTSGYKSIFMHILPSIYQDKIVLNKNGKFTLQAAFTFLLGSCVVGTASVV